MADSSKDSEEQKKTNPPAHNLFQNWMPPWWRDLGKSVVSQVMPANALQGLISAGWPDLGKSMVEQMMPTNAFEGLHKSLVPSEGLYKQVMGQLIPPTVIETWGKSEVNLSPPQAEIVQTLSQRYLQDLAADAEPLADEREAIDEEELQELFHDTESARSDQFHAKFIKTAAGAGRWLEEEFPKLQQKTNRMLSDLITRFLHEFIPALNLYLGTTYGVPGLMVASTISAAVGLITDQEKRAIDRQILLDRSCPYCDAKPGEQCVTKGGKNPGTKTAIHKDRWQG